MKKEFASVRWSQIPPNQWLKVVLIEPSQCIPMAIPNVGSYILFKAYFPFIKGKRLFNIIFPYSAFNRAMKAIPQKDRQPENAVEFEFKKLHKNKLDIRNWRVIE